MTIKTIPLPEPSFNQVHLHPHPPSPSRNGAPSGTLMDGIIHTTEALASTAGHGLLGGKVRKAPINYHASAYNYVHGAPPVANEPSNTKKGK